jgi:hypothetical protein
MKPRWTVALLLVGFLGVGTAYADSDGYYCTGRGYLAYQFGLAAPPVGPHRLNIIRFGGASGFEAAVVFNLPQFQVQGILCGEGSVRIAAYDAVYTVQLDEMNRPVSYESVPWMDRGHIPPEFVGHSQNLGAWNQAANTLTAERLSLGPADDGGQYLLEVSGKAIESERCESIVTSRLIRTDRNGREVQQLEIFRGRGVRDCGGH